MKTTEDLFVPYSIALLAKEKGFEEECLAVHTDTGDRIWYFKNKNIIINGNDYKYVEITRYPHPGIYALLYQQLIDWFINKHSIFIEIKLDKQYSDKKTNCFYFSLFKLICAPAQRLNMRSLLFYNTYTETVIKALEEAFKLI